MHPEIAEILTDWTRKINEDEFYLARSFDRLIEKKSSSDAFNFIPDMIHAILLTDDDFIASQLVFYLNCLYGKADTTEIHPVFQETRRELEQHLIRLDGDDARNEYKDLKRDLRLT